MGSLPEIIAAMAGILGVGLSLLGTFLYLRGIRRGTTKPHRGSWLVWAVIAVVAALSHGADGGGWSLLVLSVQAVSTLVVLAVAVRCGVGWFTPVNLLMLAVAALGVLGWVSMTDPTAASACAAAADGAGLVALLPKTWADPNSETLATYALAGVTGLLAVVAVQAWDPALLIYPVYFCLGNSATAVFIALRRRSLRRTTRVTTPQITVDSPAPVLTGAGGDAASRSRPLVAVTELRGWPARQHEDAGWTSGRSLAPLRHPTQGGSPCSPSSL